jgi:peptidoglycan/xylan/chitin deacetylase (PgdA/CDA1 family)
MKWNMVVQESMLNLKGKKIALKIDVDTERGTRIGVPHLLSLFEKYGISATFLFSMGPDNTGRSIRRLFRPGFFKKVSRTSVLKIYGVRTLLNGVFLKGPHIGKKHAAIMLETYGKGHEVGIHCYDHVEWHDKLHKWDLPRVEKDVKRAHDVFREVFGWSAKTMGAAGWQASFNSLSAYDDQGLDYASDTRGTCAFYPVCGDRISRTLQVPTTLPTLDELLGREDYPENALISHYQKCITEQNLNVFTLHAELEGMAYQDWFEKFLQALIHAGVQIVPMQDLVKDLLQVNAKIPTLRLTQVEIDGRSGFCAGHE